MHAHGRFEQEAWTYDEETLRALPRATSCCTSGSSRTCAPRRPRRRAAGCRSSARGSLIRRRRGWAIPTPTATGRRCGSRRCWRPARARSRSTCRGRLDRRWAGAGDRRRRGGRRAPAPLDRIPVWVRNGAMSSPTPTRTSRAASATPPSERPLEATLWGEPPCGRALARLADGTRCDGHAVSGRSRPERAVATRLRRAAGAASAAPPAETCYQPRTARAALTMPSP